MVTRSWLETKVSFVKRGFQLSPALENDPSMNAQLLSQRDNS